MNPIETAEIQSKPWHSQSKPSRNRGLPVEIVALPIEIRVKTCLVSRNRGAPSRNRGLPVETQSKLWPPQSKPSRNRGFSIETVAPQSNPSRNPALAIETVVLQIETVGDPCLNYTKSVPTLDKSCLARGCGKLQIVLFSPKNKEMLLFDWHPRASRKTQSKPSRKASRNPVEAQNHYLGTILREGGHG